MNEQDDALLQSAISLARIVFGAPAASVFRYDGATDTLIFEAVSGAGSGTIEGWSVPASHGIVGAAVQTGHGMVVADLESNPDFDASFAQTTGYVPSVICVAPLVHSGRLLGVVEVLDPDLDLVGELRVLSILEALAEQVAHLMEVRLELGLRDGGDAAAYPKGRLLAVIDAIPAHRFSDESVRIVTGMLDIATAPA